MTSLNTAEFKSWYMGLPDTDKMIFLALVLGHLTIHARAFGIDQAGAEQTRSLNGLNELQHQISFHFAGIGAKQIPEGVFLQTLLEKASTFGLSSHLEESLEYARNSIERREKK